jgi:phage terminase small subunit
MKLCGCARGGGTKRYIEQQKDTEKMENITTRHRRFVQLYTGEAMGNGAAAARGAGYSESRARKTAYDLLQDADIQAMITERLDELAMSAAEALKRTSDIARINAADYFEVDDQGRLYLDVSAVQEAGAQIKKITVDEDGRVEVEFYDKQRALRDIMDAHGVFNHRQKIDHTTVDEITIEVVGDAPDIPPPPSPRETAARPEVDV